MTAEMGPASCSVCGEDGIELVPTFTGLPRVTSDCRPFPAGGKVGICRNCHTVQKPADPLWREEAAAIYGRYDIFRQAAGHAEQRIFQSSGASQSRSDTVLGKLQSIVRFDGSGTALDVGCGNGPTLRALSRLAPGWRLFGHEISEANEPHLAKIPGFVKLFTGELSSIEGKYDLITMFHSLEHFPEPSAALARLREFLADDGVLLVEVPNVRANVYDLLVADHRTHFERDTLALAAREAGWPNIAVFEDWAFKELTLLAADKELPAPVPSARSPLDAADLQRSVAWLDGLVQSATDVAGNATQFGVFGTSIAGTWLFGPLMNRVAFFVDEDPNRVGQQHEGKPILSPAEVPPQATVFVPLVSAVADAVASRLRERGIDVRVPPPMLQ